MGRRVPSDNNILIAPFLRFSFSIVGLVTSIVIITFLCSARFRRKSSPHATMSGDDTYDTSTSPPIAVEGFEHDIPCTSSGVNNLPLPPSMKQPNAGSNVVKRAASERKLSFNLSLRMPRSFSVARKCDKKEENDIGDKKERLKPDESLWMKTIILGGKCVPDEEEDAIIYEGKGKRISAYHPRNSTSRSLSRQCSNINSGGLSISQPQLQPREEKLQKNLTFVSSSNEK
ncbi:hypothetical protein RJT34_08363 [Clitoria ternatea]|uniref:Uncharacterized protein n=1 Tax=Clitoria ternatea TaxID=43366 RepID=A0AAN9K4C9_CLITE